MITDHGIVGFASGSGGTLTIPITANIVASTPTVSSILLAFVQVSQYGGVSLPSAVISFTDDAPHRGDSVYACKAANFWGLAGGIQAGSGLLPCTGGNQQWRQDLQGGLIFFPLASGDHVFATYNAALSLSVTLVWMQGIGVHGGFVFDSAGNASFNNLGLNGTDGCNGARMPETGSNNVTVTGSPSQMVTVFQAAAYGWTQGNCAGDARQPFNAGVPSFPGYGGESFPLSTGAPWEGQHVDTTCFSTDVYLTHAYKVDTSPPGTVDAATQWACPGVCGGHSIYLEQATVIVNLLAAGNGPAACRPAIHFRHLSFAPCPAHVTSFSPTSVSVGDTVDIYGDGLDTVGAASVLFDGVEATSVTVIDDTHIQAVVPIAATGELVVCDQDAGTVTIAAPAGFDNIAVRVDGVEYGPVPLSSHLAGVAEIQVGAYLACNPNAHDIDYVKVGTTAYGSSDVFSYDFTAAVVPPFDSAVNPGDLVVSGGILSIDNMGADAYALKTVGQGGPNLYIQVRVRERDAGDCADVVDINYPAGNTITGIFPSFPSWAMDGDGPDLSATAVNIGSWQVLDIHLF